MAEEGAVATTVRARQTVVMRGFVLRLFLVFGCLFAMLAGCAQTMPRRGAFVRLAEPNGPVYICPDSLLRSSVQVKADGCHLVATAVSSNEGVVLTNGNLETVVNQNRQALDACHREYLSYRPDQKLLDMRVSMAVKPDGGVLYALVKDMSSSAPLFERCVLGVLRGLRFEVSGSAGLVVATLPLAFDHGTAVITMGPGSDWGGFRLLPGQSEDDKDIYRCPAQALGKPAEVQLQECTRIDDGPPAGEESGRNQEAVGTVVKSHHASLKACYERVLEYRPDFVMAVLVSFVIKNDGSVHGALVSEALSRSPAFEKCVLDTFGSMQFGDLGEHKGWVVVSYPLAFSTGQTVEQAGAEWMQDNDQTVEAAPD